jgi:hypothetical protein
MPRPKLTEEEYKARKAERNKQYYQKTKDSTKEKYKTNYKEAIAYIISLGNISPDIIHENLHNLKQQYHTLILDSLKIGDSPRQTEIGSESSGSDRGLKV